MKTIHEACRDVGFFYITGHNVCEHTTNNVMKAARNFFNLPFEKKNALSMRNSKAYRGYTQKGAYIPPRGRVVGEKVRRECEACETHAHITAVFF